MRIYSVLTAAVLTLSLLFLLQTSPTVDAQAGVTNFDTVVVSQDLIVVGDVTGGGDVAYNGDLLIGSTLTRVGATQTVTTGGTITPTASVMLLASSATVTPTLLLTGTAGSQVTLIQTSNQSIILTEAGNRVMAGAVTLGQYDNITFYSDGTRWIEIGRVNN